MRLNDGWWLNHTFQKYNNGANSSNKRQEYHI